MDDLELITTSDGSHSLRNRKLNETYHSVHGARRESMHVFLKNGLEYYLTAANPRYVSILEIGFGTGLNAFLTFLYSRFNDVGIRYVSLEPFPLIEKIWSQLNYGGEEQSQFELIHRAAWNRDEILTDLFTLHKQMASVEEVDLQPGYDIVFFDAFAPSIQPQLWTIDVLKKVTDVLVPGGVFVTYSAKGQLKRDLKQLGLNVETLPGPPGKLEMVRAIRPLTDHSQPRNE